MQGNEVELVQTEIVGLGNPLRELVTNLDAQIVEKADELEGLRDARKQAAKMLRLADPTFEADQRPGPKGKAAPGKIVSAERLVEIQAWLVAHADDPLMQKGFTASEI